MNDFPATNAALVVRTDFTDEAAWIRLCSEIDAHAGVLRAYYSYVSDPSFAEFTTSALIAVAQRDPDRSLVFIVDHRSLLDREHPLLVVNLADEAGRSFRLVPGEVVAVAVNLALANMDFEDFADSVAADGVFRGFPEG